MAATLWKQHLDNAFQDRRVSWRPVAGTHTLDHRLVGYSPWVVFQLVTELEVALPLAVPNRQFEPEGTQQ